MSLVPVYFQLAFLAGAKAETLCADANIKLVALIVFGEAIGESAEGQLAVAYTVVNRVTHPGYPNTVSSVVNQKYGSLHQYNTLDRVLHNVAWTDAKAKNTAEYQNAKKASGEALCRRRPDPTICATDLCADDPCTATDTNRYYEAYKNKIIGKHYFVCRRRVSG